MYFLSTFTIILSLIGTIQASFLALILFLRGKKNRFNILLGALLLILSLIVSNTLFILTDATSFYPIYQHLTNTVVFLIGPNVLLLIQRYLSNTALNSKTLLHLIPSLIYFLSEWYQTPFFVLIKSIGMFWLWNTQLGLYLIFSYLKLNKSKFKSTKDFVWIKMFLNYFLVIYIYNLILRSVSNSFLQLPDELLLSATIFLIFLIIIISLKSLNDPISRPVIYEKMFVNDKNIYSNVVNLASEFIINNQLHHNPDFKISDLSIATGISERVISRQINDELGINFNKFINSFRIEEIIKNFETPGFENYTIMAIATESGFRSNSAFYKAFKEYTGLTPTQYLRHNHSS